MTKLQFRGFLKSHFHPSLYKCVIAATVIVVPIVEYKLDIYSFCAIRWNLWKPQTVFRGYLEALGYVG